MNLRELCDHNEKNYGGFSEWHYLFHKVRYLLEKNHSCPNPVFITLFYFNPSLGWDCYKNNTCIGSREPSARSLPSSYSNIRINKVLHFIAVKTF